MSEEKTDDEIKENIRASVEEKAEVTEEKTIEEQASELGWHKDGKNKQGESVSAERYMQEKPLYDTIGKHKVTLARLDAQVADLISDNKKIATKAIEENEGLLAELKVAKETALNNLEADEVRAIDKKIDTVKDEISTAEKATENYVSPNYGAFLENNEWAKDDNDIRTIAAEGIGRRFMALNPKVGDKALYDHIEQEIEKQFPPEQKKTTQKVASVNKRTTTTNSKKKTLTLADLDPDEARLARNVMEMLGKSEEDYMKTYDPSGAIR